VNQGKQAEGVIGPPPFEEPARLGKFAGALLIGGALAAFPAALVLEPAPDPADYLPIVAALLTGIVTFLVPWRRLWSGWIHVVLVLATLEVAVGAAVLSDDFAFYYVVIGMYVAFVIRDPRTFAAYMVLFAAALLSPLVYADEDLEEEVHHILVTAPVFVIAVAIVRYLHATLERRQDDYRRFAFEAVSLAERIRGRPEEGEEGDLEERLDRLVRRERGKQRGE
jgi:hypothetical protein